MQIVNFGSNIVSLNISVIGLESNYVRPVGSIKTVLTSSNLMDENSFKEPNKVQDILCILIVCKHSLDYG